MRRFLLVDGGRSERLSVDFRDLRSDDTRRRLTSAEMRALQTSLRRASRSFSERVGERVRSVRAVLIRRPRSWRTMTGDSRGG